MIATTGDQKLDRRSMPEREPDRSQILADATLMQAVADGDSASFSVLMRRESTHLVGLGLSLLRDRSEVEEIMQDAFLRLWQVAPDWEPQARVSTWLHRVVYRLAIDRLRRRRPTVDVHALEDSLPLDADTPEDALLDRQRADMVEAALDRLPPRQRTAIVLAHRDGLSQQEGAAILGLSEEAYESLLARGRRKLKVLIAEAAQDGPVNRSEEHG